MVRIICQPAENTRMHPDEKQSVASSQVKNGDNIKYETAINIPAIQMHR